MCLSPPEFSIHFPFHSGEVSTSFSEKKIITNLIILLHTGLAVKPKLT